MDRFKELEMAGKCKAASDFLRKESRGANKEVLIALELRQSFGNAPCDKDLTLQKTHLLRAVQHGINAAKILLEISFRNKKANSGSAESASAKPVETVDREAAELAKRSVLAAEANQTGESRLPPCPGSFATATSGAWTNCFGTYKWGGENSGHHHKYVGKWRNNSKNGHGTLTFPDGGRYVGEFANGNFQGHGSLTLPNGEKYVGEWRDQIKSGHGIKYRPDGSILRSGIWHNNVFLRGQEELSEQQAAQERLRVALERQAQQEQRRLEEKAEADRTTAKAKAGTRAKHASPRPGGDVKEKGDKGFPTDNGANSANGPTTIPADPSTAADVKKKPSVKVKSAMDL